MTKPSVGELAEVAFEAFSEYMSPGHVRSTRSSESFPALSNDERGAWMAVVCAVMTASERPSTANLPSHQE